MSIYSLPLDTCVCLVFFPNKDRLLISNRMATLKEYFSCSYILDCLQFEFCPCVSWRLRQRPERPNLIFYSVWQVRVQIVALSVVNKFIFCRLAHGNFIEFLFRFRFQRHPTDRFGKLSVPKTFNPLRFS